jgi:hypothetical protein
MNTYSIQFFAICPNNGARIHYSLTIETHEVIQVEQIVDAVTLLDRGYHEAFADQLWREFGGVQTLIAEHHGVSIKTTRSAADDSRLFINQNAGGMAGTPGY